jgi:hypothetical protein
MAFPRGDREVDGLSSEGALLATSRFVLGSILCRSPPRCGRAGRFNFFEVPNRLSPVSRLLDEG